LNQCYAPGYAKYFCNNICQQRTHAPQQRRARAKDFSLRSREKLHYLNPLPIHEIAERWIGKYERHRLQALSELKRGLESRDE
jgi:hypothetical protein